MRTPVILVAGQDHTDEVTGALLRRTGWSWSTGLTAMWCDG